MVWYCMTIIIFPTRQSLCCYLYHVIWTISLTAETQMPERRKTMKIIFKSPGGHLWSQCCTFEEASANLVHPKVQHYFLSVSRNMVHPKARNHFLLFEITNCSFFTFTILQWFAFICYQIEKCHQCNGRRVAHCSEETLSETMVGFSCSSFHYHSSKANRASSLNWHLFNNNHVSFSIIVVSLVF